MTSASACLLAGAPTAIYADGAACCKRLGAELGIRTFEAPQQRKVFCKDLARKPRNLPKQTGTQVLVRGWKCLRAFVPSNLKRRGPQGIKPQLAQAVYLLSHCKNMGASDKSDFLKKLAVLCRRW